MGTNKEPADFPTIFSAYAEILEERDERFKGFLKEYVNISREDGFNAGLLQGLMLTVGVTTADDLVKWVHMAHEKLSQLEHKNAKRSSKRDYKF